MNFFIDRLALEAPILQAPMAGAQHHVRAADPARRGGHVVVVGMPRADSAVTLPGFPLFYDEKHLHGCVYGSAQVRRDFPRFISLIETGRLDVGSMVTQTIALDEMLEWVKDGEAALSGTAAVLSGVGTLIREGGAAVTVGSASVPALAGNTLANVLTGNTGNNVLDGGAGADTLRGGAGDDTYKVSGAGDVVTEGADAGLDTCQCRWVCAQSGYQVSSSEIGEGLCISHWVGGVGIHHAKDSALVPRIAPFLPPTWNGCEPASKRCSTSVRFSTPCTFAL